MIYELQGKGFWLDEVCDALVKYLQENKMQNERVVCAAGMTPSAPIHFGILREIAISAFVQEELTRRRIKNTLVYYWDDYDHFCKIPYYTTKDAVQEHLNKPLGEVPDFNGLYQSYGKHYMKEFEECLHICGFTPNYNYQEKLYKSGYYTGVIQTAIKKRKEIFDIISESTKKTDASYREKRENYYPLEIYCANCGKDKTAPTNYDAKTDTIAYTCKSCGFEGAYVVAKNFAGKLAWKANWAARWSDDAVCFESSGENQLTDTGSYAVASKIATKIFGGKVPFSLLYRFIGMPGIAKVSRAQGKRTLAKHFVRVLEPAIVRWLLVKNPPNKAFSVDIEKGIFRIYHEWDEFCQKVASSRATETELRIYEIAISGVECSKIAIPFRTITTALGINDGDEQKTACMLKKMINFDGTSEELYKLAELRIRCAKHWLYNYMPQTDIPRLRDDFNAEYFARLTSEEKSMIAMLLKEAHTFTTEENVKFALQKVCARQDTSTEKQDDARKKLFCHLYQLLFSTDKGPRLTTVLCLIDSQKLYVLLQGGIL